MLAKKYFFVISYNGGPFSGWQSQSNGNGVQEEIEDALERIFKESIKIHGCGRTDAGVHADNYVFHALIPGGVDGLKFKLNKVLSDEIAIKKILPVALSAHAQKDSLQRVYTYYFHLEKDPLLNVYSAWYPIDEIDIELMKRACTLIESATDFKNFCLNPKKHNSTICAIEKVQLNIHPSDKRYAIRFYGDHFLRSMIRLLVGELIEVGLGKTTLADFEDYLYLNKEKQKHHKAYPQGLHLTSVQYSYLKVSLNNPFSI